MLPTKLSVGIEARSKEEAEQIVMEQYSNQMNFELIYLDVAENDVARYLKHPKVI